MINAMRLSRKYRKEVSQRIKVELHTDGQPIENAFTEVFYARLHEKCLNTNRFLNLKRARKVIERVSVKYSGNYYLLVLR